MGACSVTGKGEGSAEKSGLKGPSNMRNMFVPQICPHVVMAGEIVTGHFGDEDQGQAVVYFPTGPLPNGADSYIVILTPLFRDEVNEIAAVDYYVVPHEDADGLFDYFTIYSDVSGGPTGSWGRFMYEVTTVGFGLDIVHENPTTP